MKMRMAIRWHDAGLGSSRGGVTDHPFRASACSTAATACVTDTIQAASRSRVDDIAQAGAMRADHDVGVREQADLIGHGKLTGSSGSGTVCAGSACAPLARDGGSAPKR
jgi:hypothetical protein